MSKTKELIELIELLGAQGDKVQNSLINTQKQEKRVYNEEYLSDISTLNKIFLKSYKFTKGQFVKWKKGLKNKKLPYEDQPAIVLDVLDKPIYGEYDPGSPYFREPLDLILGMGEDDDFLIFHYDKRRFEPYKLKKKAEP